MFSFKVGAISVFKLKAQGEKQDLDVDGLGFRGFWV